MPEVSLSRHYGSLHLMVHAIPGRKFGNTLHQGRGWPELGGQLQSADIRTTLAFLENWTGNVFLDRGFVQSMFQRCNQFFNRHWQAVANIQKSPWCVAGGLVGGFNQPHRVGFGRGVAGTLYGLNQISHVGVIAGIAAIVVNLNGLAFQNTFCKCEEHGVGPAPGTVHREKPQTGGG